MALASVTRQNSYVLGHDDRELDRLSAQAAILDPLTLELLRAAGMHEGMRVLDVGCGAGDVAFLAARMVGPLGKVVAVDRSDAALARAEARARGLGLENVEFLQGDPAEMQFDRRFDAVIGRLVLMYYADRKRALRMLARQVQPGGLMIFHEMDAGGCQSWPPSLVYDWCVHLVRKALELSGACTRMGLEMPALFEDAGLPTPTLRLAAAMGGGSDTPIYRAIAEALRTLYPVLKKHGGVGSDQLDIEILVERMRAEVMNSRGVVTYLSMVGAWART